MLSEIGTYLFESDEGFSTKRGCKMCPFVCGGVGAGLEANLGTKGAAKAFGTNAWAFMLRLLMFRAVLSTS